LFGPLGRGALAPVSGKGLNEAGSKLNRLEAPKFSAGNRGQFRTDLPHAFSPHPPICRVIVTRKVAISLQDDAYRRAPQVRDLRTNRIFGLHGMNSDEKRTPMANISRTIGDIIAERLSRRTVMQGALATSVLAGLAPVSACSQEPAATASANAEAAPPAPSFSFEEITRGVDGMHHLPPGYEADIIFRWGDALFPDSPPFDPMAQTQAAQERQFGYNNDFIGFIPLDADAEGNQHAILCVNHEYTTTGLMFPGVGSDVLNKMTAGLCGAEMAAHGGSIFEIVERDGHWAPIIGSRFNRRITAMTPIDITGPAAGSPRLQTSADPTGTHVLGTLNNCAGGITPWHTYLMSEENYNSNFLGQLPAGHPETNNHRRYGIPGNRYAWGLYEARFDLGSEPNEPNRFGWMVEVDVLEPDSVPKKRTALGRFKHEGGENVVAPDGRLVIYMGDDEAYQHVYKFVTAGRFDSANREANADLLDEGTIYVARFDGDGTVRWLPLVHGTGPLTAENGFESQADVLIETRRAALLLGATQMDRPEDVEPNPHNGRVYVMLTNNAVRTEEHINDANPRAPNDFGHIIEITEPGGDFTALESRWEILIKCGDPARLEFGAMWNPATSAQGWFGSPDNCAIDPSGRLWVATDGNEGTGANDGLWAIETDGPERGKGKAFFRTPIGAELCGPRFSSDGKTLFLAVQHPGDGAGANFENPSTRWPDFEDAMPPRPSVLAIRRTDGGIIGS
jgi:secreted PhoX family phosphatase